MSDARTWLLVEVVHTGLEDHAEVQRIVAAALAEAAGVQEVCQVEAFPPAVRLVAGWRSNGNETAVCDAVLGPAILSRAGLGGPASMPAR